ncbi:hypothetical protein BP6252_08825 [Coleophoma cylindrospora]|uniref:C2H2-type domain-containing protein n=1 Tax=Coleophoma cylindrospora TaxID=1849047 RepID=A0A3D8R6Y5_9HELO|nr:hypothetical protein BP6252_08825 [Coleophoma cylindrospora]
MTSAGLSADISDNQRRQQPQIRSRKRGATTPKAYLCNHGDCGKSFTRSEHLQRHALNHSAGEIICERCGATFKRPDLLKRHLIRHNLRDKAAGGAGLGILDTKRVYKRMTKFSGHGGATLPARVPDGRSKAQNELATSESQSVRPVTSTTVQPFSSPASQLMSESASGTSEEAESTSNLQHLGLDDITHQPSDLRSPQRPTDTACFTTLPRSRDSSVSLRESQGYLGTTSLNGTPGNLMERYSDSWLPVDVDHAENLWGPDAMVTGFTPSWESFETADTEVLLTNNPYNSICPKRTGSAASPQSESANMNNSGQDYSAQEKDPSPVILQTIELAEERLPAQPVPNDSNSPPIQAPNVFSSTPVTGAVLLSPFPIIGECARMKIIDLIKSLQPHTPEGEIFTGHEQFFSLPDLQESSNFFFSQFNVSYPLIHRASFNASEVNPLYLLSILILGATYKGKEAHQMAVCIYDVLLLPVVKMSATAVTVDLWIMQTLMLLECFGTSRAGRKQHEQAHLFHGLLVDLIKMSDNGDLSETGFRNTSGDLEIDWKWVVLFSFMWDVQYSSLFSRTPIFSAKEVSTSLPCDSILWNAASAPEWVKARRHRRTDLSFLAVLGLLLEPDSAPPPPNLEYLSLMILLHGLMSVSLEMRRQSYAVIWQIESDSSIKQWEARISRALEAWKVSYDTYAMCTMLSLTDDRMRNDLTRDSMGIFAIYHAAHVVLNADIVDLQICAGAQSVSSRNVSQANKAEAQMRLKAWTEETRSRRAGWHAASMLREGILNLENWDVNEVFHYPWCLYLATLTCWALNQPNDEPQQLANRDIDDSSCPAQVAHDTSPVQHVATPCTWDSRAEMNSLISSMTTISTPDAERPPRRYRTNGLTSEIAKQLGSVRWAVARDGMKVLQALSLVGVSDSV